MPAVDLGAWLRGQGRICGAGAWPGVVRGQAALPAPQPCPRTGTCTGRPAQGPRLGVAEPGPSHTVSPPRPLSRPGQRWEPTDPPGGARPGHVVWGEQRAGEPLRGRWSDWSAQAAPGSRGPATGPRLPPQQGARGWASRNGVGTQPAATARVQEANRPKHVPRSRAKSAQEVQAQGGRPPSAPEAICSAAP